VFKTLITLSRELWPTIDSVMSSCCSHDWNRGVSDTLYHSRHCSRDRQYECDCGI